jgi:hypothetical protein
VKKPKKSVTLRLSETTVQELAKLADQQKLSQADVVSVLVHCAYHDLDWDELDRYFDIARLG